MSDVDRPDWSGENAVVPVEPASTAVVPSGLWEDWGASRSVATDPAEATGQLAAVSIEAAVNDPAHLSATIERLPSSLVAKFAEHMKIPPMKGGAKAAEAALMSRLDDGEREAYHDWVASLTDEERWAIRSWFNGEYR
jgi:hypothetical protein